MSFQAKHENECSLGFWKKWLYKLLLYRFDSSLAFGLAELVCGGNPQRTQKNEQIGYFVLSGQGTLEYTGTRHSFKAGDRFTMLPDMEHCFDCDTPTRLLVACAPTAIDLTLTPAELKPTHVIRGSGQCQYVLGGRIKIAPYGGDQVFTAGTAFYVGPNMEYTLQNIGNTNALILTVSGEAATVGHEQRQARK
ncbi:MAG: hypothetical protein ACYDBJ_13590 [Aggregatilineales bacterium]